MWKFWPSSTTADAGNRSSETEAVSNVGKASDRKQKRSEEGVRVFPWFVSWRRRVKATSRRGSLLSRPKKKEKSSGIFFMINFDIFYASLFVHFFNRSSRRRRFSFFFRGLTPNFSLVSFARSEWVEAESGHRLPAGGVGRRPGEGQVTSPAASHDPAYRKWVRRRCELMLSVVVYLICTDGERMSAAEEEEEKKKKTSTFCCSSSRLSPEFCAKTSAADRKSVGRSGRLRVRR